MECSECNYGIKTNDIPDFAKKPIYVCKLTNRMRLYGCAFQRDEVNSIKDLKICYNCKSWIGGGDFGLSCKKNYYLASSDGTRAACDEFEGKENEV